MFKGFLKNFSKDILILLGLLTCATMLAFVFFYFISHNSANIALIFILSLILIVRYTDGYFYGIFASIYCVVGVNYFFTYPYFKVNFTLTGYPLTFLGMLAITLITSATTTLMKKQNEIIKERERQIVEGEKEKIRANLLRAISHDLRTPLTGIIGLTNWYVSDYDKISDGEKLNIIKGINEDSNWLLNMVENILTVTRIQNENSGIKKDLEVIDEVISESVTRFKKRYPDTIINVSLPEDIMIIPMDPILIEQVIINLLENAALHSTNNIKTDLFITSNEEYVDFHIRDYGDGIPKERLLNLFDGQMTSISSSDGRKGMGIGLSICKSIIDAHGGRILAINNQIGSEFIFSLPNTTTSI